MPICKATESEECRRQWRGYLNCISHYQRHPNPITQLFEQYIGQNCKFLDQVSWNIERRNATIL